MDQPALGQGAGPPPVGLGRDRVAGTLEPLGQCRPVRLDIVLAGQPERDQVLPGGGPPVVKEHRLAGVEDRRHQARPVRAEFGAHQVDQLGVTGRRCRRHRVVESELAQHHPGGRGQHAVAAGEGLGELVERGRVDHRAAGGGAGRGQCHRHTAAGGDRRDGRVDGLVHRPRVGQRPVVQTAQRPAPNALALPGAQCEFHSDVLGPALAEFPGLGDPFGDGPRPLAGRAEDRAQLVVDGIGEHRAERLVGAGQFGDLPAQRGEIRLGGAVDGTQVQLGAEVDQQLVAPRGGPVGDGLD